MALADGIRFMRWAAERFDEVEPARCQAHPSEGQPALRELLDESVPLLDVQRAHARSGALAPTVLIDLVHRPDLLDLVRVANLESAGQSSYDYDWHAVRWGYADFAVVHLRICRPARAELVIAFPIGLPGVRQLLEAAAAVGWMTISSARGEFVLPRASLGVGLAACLSESTEQAT